MLLIVSEINSVYIMTQNIVNDMSMLGRLHCTGFTATFII